MSSLTTYKSLSVLTPDPIGLGGLAINNNFKTIADSLSNAIVRGVSVDNSGEVLPNGIIASIYIPASYNISNWAVISTDDTPGSITVDLQAVAQSSFVPNSTSGAASIVGSGTKPNLASAAYASFAPAGWSSIQLTGTNYLLFVISGVTAIKFLRVELTLTPR